ncbi:hypothetical protein TNCV_4325621 [Trichonephila clavipes]|nr:hypothetical protein TNCV_4325621 [Trichonephila clavipes]
MPAKFQVFRFNNSGDLVVELVPPDKIGNLNGEVVNLARQITLKVDSNDIQELLHFHNQEMTIHDLIEEHKQEQDIEELESVDPVQSED